MKTAVLIQSKSEGELIKITFPFSQQDLERVRTLQGRKWRAEAKCWSAPPLKENIKLLREWNFQLCPALNSLISETKINANLPPEITKIDGFLGNLFPFQKIGVSFIEKKQGRCLIGDEMGLGKTIQSLAWLQLHPENRPAIIICPASLKYNWAKEINQWMTGETVQIINGSKIVSLTSKIIIINYDIVLDWLEILQNFNPSVVIMDECHYIKNSSAQRTKAVKKLCRVAKHVIALSGTPILNRPIEIFNALNCINPGLFSNGWKFAHRYCGAKHNGFGWNFNGASNVEELNELLTSSVMIRRKKEDVLTDLPAKSFSFIPIELDNKSEYDRAEYNFIDYVRMTKGDEKADKASQAETLAAIEGLKQIAVKGKLQAIKHWIEDFLESDQKLVLFANHKFVIDELMTAFPGISVKIDGSVGNAERQTAVDSFQNNPETKLFVGNIQAAGVGITLTAASNVAFVELPWTPGALQQAEDRCHRIGQKDNVMIYHLLAKGTIEEKIAALLDSKRKVLDAVLDGKITAQESLLSELLKSICHE